MDVLGVALQKGMEGKERIFTLSIFESKLLVITDFRTVVHYNHTTPAYKAVEIKWLAHHNVEVDLD
jgi:hypothetical protein